MRAKLIIVLREGMKQTISPTIHLWVDEKLFIAFNELGDVLERALKEIYWPGAQTLAEEGGRRKRRSRKDKERKDVKEPVKWRHAISFIHLSDQSYVLLVLSQSRMVCFRALITLSRTDGMTGARVVRWWQRGSFKGIKKQNLRSKTDKLWDVIMLSYRLVYCCFQLHSGINLPI